MDLEEQQSKENALLDLLDREPEELAAALEGVKPGELSHAWWECSAHFNVYGSLLAAAAEKNRTAHLTLLLDQGWDIEGGVDSREVFSLDWGTSPATPLSAAILGGSVEAARLLLERGAKSWDCCTVCRTALLMLDEGDGRYVPCIRTVLGLGEDADVRGELLRRVPPHWIVAQCTPEELRACLRSRRHDVSELVQTIRLICSPRSGSHPYRKLLILSEDAPEGFRERGELDMLLFEALMIADCMIPKRWEELGLAMIARWRELSGPVRDISIAMHFLRNSKPEDARQILGMLGDGADALIADGGRFGGPYDSESRNDGMILSALTKIYVSEERREIFLDYLAVHPDQLLRILRAHMLDGELELAAGVRAVVQTKSPGKRIELLTELNQIRREGTE